MSFMLSVIYAELQIIAHYAEGRGAPHVTVL